MIVSASEFLSNSSTAWILPRTLLVHQTGPLGPALLAPNSWTEYHPNALHVRWSDEDNRRLVRLRYPHLLDFYDNTLRLVVQRTDLARLLYLHAFGGLYVDMDYEAHTDVLALLTDARRSSRSNWVVESPALMNEVMQNSFMFASRPNHAFWLHCANGARDAFEFVHHGCDFSSSCGFLKVFASPFTSEAAHIVMTQYLTGSAMLDKVHVRHPDAGRDVGLLRDGFFHGPHATHHHHNSWVTLGTALAPLTLLGGLLLLSWTLTIVLVVRRWCRYDSCGTSDRRGFSGQGPLSVDVGTTTGGGGGGGGGGGRRRSLDSVASLPSSSSSTSLLLSKSK